MTKPAKPPGFPLYPHARGVWAKKIAGKTHYFGRWDDPAGALAEYEALTARKAPAKPTAGTSVQAACNAYLAAKRRQQDAGELSSITWAQYRRTALRMIAFFGAEKPVADLHPLDFAGYRDHMAKKWNVVSLGNEVCRVRQMFKWCYDTRLIREPLHFGPGFRAPSAKTKRKHRREIGKKLFTAEQIQLMLDEASIHLRAMILLGINCGFGNSDCATLPLSAVDLDRGWHTHARPKTEIERSCPLWPETVAALRLSLSRRYQPGTDAEGRFFVMNTGKPWDNACNPIAKQTRQVLERANVGRGAFYYLRHTFATIGGGSKDEVAVAAIMGHSDASMAAVYRESVDEARLTAVTDHVRRWLFGPA